MSWAVTTPPSRVSLAPLTQADLPLVEAWLRAEHVRRFWGDPEENYRNLACPEPGTSLAVILEGGRRVGLVLWRHPSRRELDEAGLCDIPTSVMDMDIMLGELEAVGRGIGPAAIALVAQRVLADPSVPCLIAACMRENAASRLAFAKAGFGLDREFDDPLGGWCFLLKRERGEKALGEAPTG